MRATGGYDGLINLSKEAVGAITVIAQAFCRNIINKIITLVLARLK